MRWRKARREKRSSPQAHLAPLAPNNIKPQPSHLRLCVPLPFPITCDHRSPDLPILSSVFLRVLCGERFWFSESCPSYPLWSIPGLPQIGVIVLIRGKVLPFRSRAITRSPDLPILSSVFLRVLCGERFWFSASCPLWSMHESALCCFEHLVLLPPCYVWIV